MGEIRDIKNALRKLTESGEETYCIPCTVSSVDISAKTCYCVPLDGRADLMDVRLMTDTSKVGFLIIPKVDSYVIVSMINNEGGYVAMFSDVQEIQLNGDNYDGIPIVGNLVQKLNNLENAFNKFVVLYNAHTHVETSTNTLVPSTLNKNVLTNTTTAMLRNATVKHGNG